MNEPRFIHAAEDWGVVFLSIPSKNKREIVKRLEKIFELDKHDAEQILSKVPLLLVDNLTFGLAVRIKKFFQEIGVAAETTNHEMIKKNCFHVYWPQTPDLSFFMKNEAGTVEAPVPEKKESAKSFRIPWGEKKDAGDEIKPAEPRSYEAPQSEKPSQESSTRIPPQSSVFQGSAQGSPAAMDPFLEQRVKELEETLLRLGEEKQALQSRHEEALGKMRDDLQRRIEEEKEKRAEIAKAYEALQQESQDHQVSSQAGEESRSRAEALGERVRALEADLTQKAAEIEELHRQKNDLAQHSDKTVAETQQELASLRDREAGAQQELSALRDREAGAQRELLALRDRETGAQQELSALRDREAGAQQELSALRDREAGAQQELSALRGRETGAQQELATLRGREAEMQQELLVLRGREMETHQETLALRSREQEFLRKIEDLERKVQEMTDALRSREDVLAQFEKQISELEGSASSQLTQQKEDLTRQYEKAAAAAQQEFSALRGREAEMQQELLVLRGREMETHQETLALRSHETELLGKVEGLERNVHEVTESLRFRDEALAQLEKRILELETNLKDKTSAVERLIQQKDDLTRQFVMTATGTQEELTALRAREQESLKKVEGLERNVQEMTASLQSRDAVLAQLEKQISELG